MRSRRTAALLIVTLAIVGVAIWLSSPFERTIATFTESSGGIQSGEKFGAEVGMSRVDAYSTLVSRGLLPTSSTFNELARGCGGHTLQHGQEFVGFSDESWRRGIVCLVLENDHVVLIGWNFNPLTP